MSGEPEPFDTVCQMETPGLPFSTIIFAPSKGEILYVLDGGVLRMPVQVGKVEDEKMEYTFVWTREAGTATYTGTATRAEGKLTFETEEVKGGVCKPSGPIDEVYKSIEELGVAEGDFISSAGLAKMKFPASGSQQLDEGKGPRVYTYRVIGRQGDGVLLGETSTPLTDSASSSMSTNSFTPMGEMLVEVAFPGQKNELRRTYVRPGSGAAGAPPAPPEPPPKLDPVIVNKAGVDWVLSGGVARSVSVDKVACTSAAGSRYCDITWAVERGLLGTVWAKVYDGDGVKQKDTVGIDGLDARSATPGEKFKSKQIIERSTKRVPYDYR